MRTQNETDEQDLAQAKKDRDNYFLAMINGNSDTCAAIEEAYGLYGYVPELVSIGLNAAAIGKHPEKAVETYIVERMMSN